uniref:DUF3109 family protein n=1 Tax=Nippostrongylus brasiliensis TaxID=27835 RepID=A0A0N4YH18_NIPBR
LGGFQYTWVDEEDDCTLEFCRKELEAGKIALNLALEIRWDDWSECEQNRQLRERQAHCYLVRKSGYEIPRAEDQLPHEYKWMPKLNSLFDQEPFSSLLASLFVDEEVMKKCYYDEKRVQASFCSPKPIAFGACSFAPWECPTKIAEARKDLWRWTDLGTL